MSIKSYKITEQTTQRGGIIRVCVAFTDHLGRTHNRGYDFPPGIDVPDEIAIRQTHVEQGLVDQEVNEVVKKIESGETYTLVYATDAELKTKLEEIEDEKQNEIDKLTVEKTNITMEIAKDG